MGKLKTVIPPETEATLRELYRNGASDRDVAAHFNKTGHWWSQKMRKHLGIPSQRRRNCAKVLPPVDVPVTPPSSPLPSYPPLSPTLVLGKHTKTDEDTYTKNGMWNATRISTERIRTLPQLIAFMEVDITEWEVVEMTCNKWEMGWVNRTNWTAEHKELFQVKARFKRKVAVISAREEVLALLEDARKQAPPYVPVHRQTLGDRLLEVSIFDAHFGKLCWAPETGSMDYDLRIAEHLYLDAIHSLIERVQHHAFEQILFPVGNDGINSEATGDTTGGTRQDNDSRPGKVFRVFRQAVMKGIAMLRQVAPVRVVPVQGNHDRHSIMYLSELLQVAYENDKEVEVDSSFEPAKYHEYGQCMICFTHGNEEKHDDLGFMMATDRKEIWGRTTYRECHIGHFHMTRSTVKPVGEKMGVKVRILPSLCPTDAWHRLKGYTSNLQGGEAFVWDKEYGLVENQHFTVPPAK